MRSAIIFSFVTLFVAVGAAAAQVPKGVPKTTAPTTKAAPISGGPDPAALPAAATATPTATTPVPALTSGGASAISEGAAPAAASAAPATAAASLPAIQHAPVNEVQSGALALRFSVRDPERLGRLVVRWIGEAEGSSLGETAVLRGEDGYAARLPEQAVQPPAVRYWVIEETDEGGERAVFASAKEPHRVLVFHDEPTRLEEVRLDRRGGKRSTIVSSGEYVDFGSRVHVAGGESLPDRYYRLEAGYAYSFLTLVEDVQLSVVHVRGDGALVETTRGPGFQMTTTASHLTVGADYGRAQVTVQPLEWVRFRGSVLLGASQLGFEAGGGGALVLGDPSAVNLSLSSEVLTTLGMMNALRMGFLAAQGWPMGATIEVSDFPVGDDHGVRLLYDVGYEFAPGSSVVLRGGYQARTSVRGAPAIGAAVRWAF
jgi:hypothetical protein